MQSLGGTDTASTSAVDAITRGVTSGDEGAHTVVITSTGLMYTFGTAHNGVLANLGEKTNALGLGLDELEGGGDE